MDRIGWWLGICLAFAMSPAWAEGSAPARQAQGPFLGGFLKETRIVYPLQVGAWHARGEHLFQNQAYGVSVRYNADDAADGWIDIYFYPAGVLSSQELQQVAQIERDNIARAQQLAGMPAPDMGELRTFSFKATWGNGRPRPVDAWAADFGMTLEGTQYSSVLALLLDRMYLVKGRYSVPSDHRSRGDASKLLEDFMARLDPQLVISSSGGCWMPLPIERLADDQPDPDRKLLATLGKPARHFLLDDRVLSRDPGSADALTLMRMGMALDHRIFDGCEGSQPENPVVPDGMREIRLEYRAPAEQDAPAPGIRPPKVMGS